MDACPKLDPHGRLKGVNPRLVAVMEKAHAAFPYFRINEGLRTKERQAQLVADGKSKTMNSRHIVGDAIDVACFNGGAYSGKLPDYKAVNDAVQKAAKELNERVTWGGSWKSLVDGPHFQIEHG